MKRICPNHKMTEFKVGDKIRAKKDCDNDLALLLYNQKWKRK